MRRPRIVRRLVTLAVVLGLLAGLLAIADAIARHVSQDALAARARSATGAKTANVSVSGWPFLYDVLGRGKVAGIDIHLTGVPIGQVRLALLDVRLGNVTFSRSALFSDHLQLTSIGSAAVTAEVTASELSAVAGRTVHLLGDGTIEVAGLPAVAANAAVVENGTQVVISVSGVTVARLDFGRDKLVPACSMNVTVLAGRMEATCHVAPVPERVLRTVDAAA